MEINVCKYCQIVGEAMGKQSRSLQLDFAIQHLDWLELYSKDVSAIRSLGVNIIASFAKYADSPFFNDKRILRVCLTVGSLSRHVGLKGVMKQISDRGQFARMPEFYVRWAEIYASEKNRDEFEKIYRLAVERKAEPLESVENMFREMRLKYFGAVEEVVDENTQMLFAPKASLKTIQENKENDNIHLSLAIGGTSFTQNFYSKAMQDFSNTLPVAPPRTTDQNCSTSAPDADTTLTVGAGGATHFQVYVDENMEIDQEVMHEEGRGIVSGDVCRKSDVGQVEKSALGKLSGGDAGVLKKSENVNSFSRSSESGDIFAVPKPLVQSSVLKTTSDVSSVTQNNHFLDPVFEEVVAGTYVYQGKAGIAASTPANPLAPTFEEHMQNFSLHQECSNDLDVIFPTNRKSAALEQMTAFDRKQSANARTKNILSNETGSKFDSESARPKQVLGGSLLSAVSGLTIGGEEEEEPTGRGLKSFIQSDINPWDEKVRQKIMLSHRLYPTYLHDCTTRMKRLSPGMSVVFEGENFEILEMIGEGGFAKVFKCKSEDGNTYAVKVESPSCRWEVYVCELLRIRLPQWILTGVMTVHDAYIYPNMSAIIYEYHPYGNLLDLANSLSSNKTCLGLLCVYLSWEIARIMREVHKAQIIHADLKPDNFMILRKLDENSTAEELLDEKDFTIKLIDWGRAIDMSALKGRTFTGRAGTECFDCFEMLDGRPWTYQNDFFGFIATMHVLLFGSYIKTTKNEETKKYSLLSVIKRRCNQRDVLQDVFQMCMNIESCDRLPDWTTIITGLAESVRYSLNSDRTEWKTCARDFNQAISSRYRK